MENIAASNIGITSVFMELAFCEGKQLVSRSVSCSEVSQSGTPWTVASVHGILQAKILEWVATSFSRGFLWRRDQTQVSCIAGIFFTLWATREA